MLFISILRKLEETGSCETKKPHVKSRENTVRKDRLIGNETKRDRFATATALSKRANANLGNKISRHTFSRRFNEINLSSKIQSTKSYISKKNKNSRLKVATEYVI